MPTALITGITGQDGSYLAEYLLEEGYDVHGLWRWSSTKNDQRIAHLNEEIELVRGDLADQSSLEKAVSRIQPDEVYNLAALSFVPESFNQPANTGNITGIGVTRLLEAVASQEKEIRFYQASTSELFGDTQSETQSMDTRFRPQSPYAAAKLYGHWMTVNYRDAYDMYAVSGVLFNHESPRRGKRFVTRKITRAAARIALGLQNELELGNLDAKRDWGHARDYVRAMHLMLQQDEPKDYVIGTGEIHSVRHCVRLAFDQVDLDWREYVTSNDVYCRPNEVDYLKADPSRAKEELGWEPTYTFEELIREMVAKDLEDLQSNA